TFVKESRRAFQQPGRSQIQQERKRSKSPCGHYIRLTDNSSGIFNTPRNNPRRQTELANHCLKKTGLLAIAFDKIDLTASFLHQERQHQPGKSPTRPQIQPFPRFRSKRSQLGAINYMAGPDVSQSRRSGKIDPLIPFLENSLEAEQRLKRFT